MTNEEAIKICTREKERVQSALDACADGGHYVSPDGIITAVDYVEALGMAISALRKQCVRDVTKTSVWISVEERLPEEWRKHDGDLVNYLIFMPDYGVDIGNYAKPVKKWICMGVPCKVTHWMPLPEPPEEEV